MRSRSGSGCEESDVDLAVPIPIPLSDQVSDQPQLAAHHWEAIAIPASAPLIPVPHDPAPDSAPHRLLVTTIAAAPMQRQSTQLAQHVSECSTPPFAEKTSTACSPKASDEFVKKGAPGGIARKDKIVSEKERCGRRGSDDASVGKKKATPERETPCSKEASKVKAEGAMKYENGKGSEVNDPSISRKKSKKNAAAVKELDSCPNYANIQDLNCIQVDDVMSVDTNTTKKETDIVNSSGALQGISGKKGRKSCSTQEIIVDDSVAPATKTSRKSVSPQKEEVSEKNLKRSCITPEKEVLNDRNAKRSSITPEKEELDESSSVLTKKNKKRTTMLSKDVVKQCENVPNAENFEAKLEPDNSISTNVETEIVFAQEADTDFSLKDTVTNCELEKGFACLQSDSTSPLDEQLSEVKSDIEFVISNKDDKEEISIAKAIPQTQKLSKSARRALRAQQILEAELASKNDLESCGDVKVVSNLDIEVSINSVCMKDDIVSEEPVVLPDTKDISVPKTKRGNKLKESDNIASDKCESVESVPAVQKHLEEAALDIHCEKATDQNKRDAQLSVEGSYTKESLDGMSIDVSAKNGKKGLKSTKSKSTENESKIQTSEPIPPECIDTNVWKLKSSSELQKNAENFPALSTKNSKKAWGNTSNEVDKSDEVDQALSCLSEKSEKSVKDLEKRNSFPTIDMNPVKPKRGWEMPNSSVPSSEMDVDKLSFEDLEAIVDAACKEEESKIDQTCLKENKKGKKSDLSTVTPPKTKGKENVEEEIVKDSGHCVDKIEVIDVPKPQEELIKQDEPVKSPEKPLSTPNRSSKAHRKKRR